MKEEVSSFFMLSAEVFDNGVSTWQMIADTEADIL